METGPVLTARELVVLRCQADELEYILQRLLRERQRLDNAWVSEESAYISKCLDSQITQVKQAAYTLEKLCVELWRLE